MVYPWEISVAREATHDSPLNVVRGEIGSVFELGNRVRVRIGPITAEVTSSSVERLDLARGGVAYATFKATGTRLVPPLRRALVEVRDPVVGNRLPRRGVRDELAVRRPSPGPRRTFPCARSRSSRRGSG